MSKNIASSRVPDVILDGYQLHDAYFRALRRPPPGGPEKRQLWTIVNDVLTRSQKQNWGRGSLDHLPSHKELKTVVGIPTGTVYEAIINQVDAPVTSASNFVDYGATLTTRQYEIEKAANDLTTHLTTRRTEIQEAFQRGPPYAYQLKTAVDLVSGLGASIRGKNFLANQIDSPGAVFDPIQFLSPPSMSSPAGTPIVTITDEERARFFGPNGVFKVFDDSDQVDEEVVAVAMDLVMLIESFIPAVPLCFTSKGDIKTIGKFLSAAFSRFTNDPPVFSTLETSLSVDNIEAVISKLVNGVEKVVDKWLNDFESKKSTIPQKQFQSQLQTLKSLVGLSKHLLGVVRLLSTAVKAIDSPTAENFAKLAGALAASTALLVESRAELRLRAGTITKDANKFVKRAFGVAMAPFALMDAILSFKEQREAAKLGDESVAAGHAIAGITTLGGLVLGLAGVPMFGWIGIGLIALGLLAIYLTTTHDPPIERWMETNYFGRHWISPAKTGARTTKISDLVKRYEDPGKMSFKWLESRRRRWANARPDFARQITEYYSIVHPFEIETAEIERGTIPSRPWKQKEYGYLPDVRPNPYHIPGINTYAFLDVQNIHGVTQRTDVRISRIGRRDDGYAEVEMKHLFLEMGIRSLDSFEGSVDVYPPRGGPGTGRFFRVAVDPPEAHRVRSREIDIERWRALIVSPKFSDLLGVTRSKLDEYDELWVEIELLPLGTRLSPIGSKPSGPDIVEPIPLLTRRRAEVADNT